MRKKNFWKTKWQNKFCGITKGRLRPGKNKNGVSYCVFLNCSHGFYTSVLKEWINKCPFNLPTCPLCRNKINKKDIKKILLY